jgi:hypothetical protein
MFEQESERGATDKANRLADTNGVEYTLILRRDHARALFDGSDGTRAIVMHGLPTRDVHSLVDRIVMRCFNVYGLLVGDPGGHRTDNEP